jgi:hypothetical protein
MDAKQLINIVEQGLAKEEQRVQLGEVCAQYPYFALAQFARLKAQPSLSKSDLAFAALFKQDEWMFAHWSASPKITQEVAKEALSELRDDQEPANEVQPAAIETQEAIPVEATQEDILTLINELPNSNPIAEAKWEQKEEKEPKATEPEQPNEPQKTDEDLEKSLMVMMSFTDWLNYFKTKKQKEEEEERDKKALKTHWQKEKLAAAVEEDVDEIPEPIFKQAMDSISAESGIISESLAKILASQGKIDKAIDMYKKLSLRNPEKRSYFADLIENLNSNRD